MKYKLKNDVAMPYTVHLKAERYVGLDEKFNTGNINFLDDAEITKSQEAKMLREKKIFVPNRIHSLQERSLIISMFCDITEVKDDERKKAKNRKVIGKLRNPFKSRYTDLEIGDNRVGILEAGRILIDVLSDNNLLIEKRESNYQFDLYSRCYEKSKGDGVIYIHLLLEEFFSDRGFVKFKDEVKEEILKNLEKNGSRDIMMSLAIDKAIGLLDEKQIRNDRKINKDEREI